MTSASIKYCGVMLDSARLTEKHSFYFDLLPYLAKWGYNTIWWHFTDDQGCSLRFDSRPEIASQGAFSKQELKEFISSARDLGIEVVPELESFGHMGYITKLEKYSHLSESVEGERFGAICPSNPETLEILEDLIGEVSELFPSEFIHGGMDEVNFGSCPKCRQRLAKETRWEIFAQHVEAVRGIIRKNGKKMMMWGDHLTTEPKLADRIPKDIVLCDWQYFDINAPAFKRLLEKGYEVICCPALTNFFKVIHPKESNLQNIKDFTRIAAEMQSPRVVGLMNTVWCPYRFLQGAVVHGIALGASIFRNDAVEQKGFSREFAADYFGVDAAQAVGEAIRTLYTTVPELLLVKSLAPLGWDEFEPLVAMEERECEQMGKQVAEALGILSANHAHVRRHINHYNDILASAEIVAGLAFNGRDIKKLFDIVSMDDLQKGAPHEPLAVELLKSLAKRSHELHIRARECWQKTRFEDEPERDGRAHIHQYDVSILYRLETSALFFEGLMRDARA